MNAMTFAPRHDAGAATLAQLRAKFGPLAAVLAVHVIVGYAIYSGMLGRVIDVAVPKVVK